MINITEYYIDDYYEEEGMYQARAVTVMDARTGFVLYENAQHELMYPASITKIMTALLVIEEVENLQETMVFSEYSVMRLPYYASRLNALPYDTLTVYEALYALMLRSGNDVANALAEHVSGDITTFVNLMNARAHELGATNTHFVNPCGLPGDGQHTTAYDMALIMREAINHPVFNQVNSAASFFIPPTLENFVPYGLTINNTNLLIQDGDFFNPWVIGGKTGFTNAAQHTLVSHARRGEHDVIVSVLYAPRRATFTDTTALLNYTFAMPIKTLYVNESWDLPVIQQIDGIEEEIATITAVGSNSIRVPMPESAGEISTEVTIADYLTPPVREGDVIGQKSFFAGDTFIASIDIVSLNSVFRHDTTQQATVVAPSSETLEGINLQTAFSFFAFLSVVTFVILGVLVLTTRRRRRAMYLRRMKLNRRRMQRAEYARRYQQDRRIG